MIGGPLEGFAEVVEIPVQWGDQDAMRHVNNTVYLRWFETSRISYARRLGLWDGLEATGIGPILASSHIDYRRPLTYPDVVLVGSKVERVGRSSLTMAHRIVGLASGEVAAEGLAVLVLYDFRAARSLPIPDAIRRAIAEAQGGGAVA